jgi:hypothetical protein
LQFENGSRKTAIVMKKHPVWVCAALGVSIALIVVACTITQKHGPGVSIHETYVEIYSGTKISSDDQKALDAVLKNFNKSLYKIRTYDRGNLVKTQGSLEDTRIDQMLVADAINASQKGVSLSTLQIGNPYQLNIRPAHGPAPWKEQSPSPAPVSERTKLELSKRLVSRVTPILQKYSR